MTALPEAGDAGRLCPRGDGMGRAGTIVRLRAPHRPKDEQRRGGRPSSAVDGHMATRAGVKVQVLGLRLV